MRERVRDSLIATGDTIVAVATAPGRAGIGVVRVSGPEAVALVSRFFRSPAPLTPRRACSGRFVLPGGEGLDHVVATFFKGPASYTGEDLVEVSAHGNPLILNEIVAAMCGAGARRARRGEFTGRAVANGKLDLAQAEAVRDFIEAETLAQARSALGQLEGAMSGRLRPVRESLLALVAELEAGIDFPDDAPGGEAVAGPLAARLGACARPLEVLAASFDYGRLLTGGILVSILGRPNTGKSSIFNALMSDERAIVSDVPGTTRDVVTETIEIGEIPVRLADTAGVREGGDPVETLGVQRSRETAAAADLVLLVLDGSEPLTETDQTLLRDRGPAALVVVNKTDLTPAWAPPGLPGPALRVSARSGAGIAELRESIQEWITDRRPPEAAGFVVTNARQRDCLREAAGALRQAARTALEGLPVELLLIDLYRGLEALGEVTGEVTNEDILGEIFSTFCIGK